jgi:peptidoglycan biosynthesis protein MviN/MurJ (putative lipid II flippase)
MVLGPYFIAYAMGRMNYNLASHIVMVVLSLVLGPILGVLAGPIGAAVGMAVSLIVSGLVMWIGNRQLMPAQKHSWDWTHVLLAASALLASVASIASYYWLSGFHGPFVSGIICGAIWLAVITPAAIQNPGRRLVLATFRPGRADWAGQHAPPTGP